MNREQEYVARITALELELKNTQQVALFGCFFLIYSSLAYFFQNITSLKLFPNASLKSFEICDMMIQFSK
uniref:Transmembrane protein n=1 Tax=Ascaris lumbricoides TaxID=6252 RepID=A0A0M3HIT2_ASCLU